MIPHYVVFVHGIGDERKGFNRGLLKRSQKEFAKTVVRLGSQQPAQGGIDLREALWSDVTQPDQNHLWDRLFPQMKGKGMGWVGLLTRPANWFSRLKYWSTLRRLVVNYQGDLIAYFESQEAHKYTHIHDRVRNAICDAAEDAEGRGATAGNEALLTVVAHSLGAVIASDLIYDMHHNMNGRSWPQPIRLANLITFGSPLALYNLRYGFGPAAFRAPVRMQDPYGRWINLYDPQDVIGYPLKPLNEAYADAVFVDKEINAGEGWKFWQWHRQLSPLSHTLYWEDQTLAAIIGRKAALDWLRKNQPQLEPMLKAEYEEYSAWVLRR